MSKNKLVVLSDIFGVTKALQQLVEELSIGDVRAVIIDPYQGQQLDFSSEAQAYQYFSEHVGLDSYLEYARQQLASLPAVDKVIGFSIGGSVLWRLLAEHPRLLQNSENICFYPGQVRHYLNLRPQHDCTVYLPVSEPHFAIEQMSAALKKMAKVTVVNTAYFHGYMNQLSENFERQGYGTCVQQLRVNKK